MSLGAATATLWVQTRRPSSFSFFLACLFIISLFYLFPSVFICCLSFFLACTERLKRDVNKVSRCFKDRILLSKPQHQKPRQPFPFIPLFSSFIHPQIPHPSYLLQLTTAGSHKHHRVFSVGVGSDGAHSLSPVFVQRRSLDHPQASQRLVQHQAAEIITDLLRLWTRNTLDVIKNV